MLKYIPSDIVAAWVAVSGLVSGGTDIPKSEILWTSFIIGLLLTALWTHKQTSIISTSSSTSGIAATQVAICTVSFGVWVFALGGPFATLSFYKPIYGSLALVLYSLVVPLVIPKE
jgi:hypothetical protein